MSVSNSSKLDESEIKTINFWEKNSTRTILPKLGLELGQKQ